MAAIDMKFLVVDALPTEGFVPNAIYLFKAPGAEQAQMYKADNAGTSLVKFSDSVDIKNSLMFTGNVPPALDAGYVLWYNTDEFALFLNTGEAWVEAIAVPEIPAFAGNGEANTMARSDHYHEGFVIQDPSW